MDKGKRSNDEHINLNTTTKRITASTLPPRAMVPPPINPGNAANPVAQNYSGSVRSSFNNRRDGYQDLRNARISSPGYTGSFNNESSQLQSFRNANIDSGSVVDSFNNKGNGSQTSGVPILSAERDSHAMICTCF
ncbi:hypothetical protein E2542_SST16725 [Spatholobus suberectus]|nr:hypothetical protein E2542_SST16725 [Spatholobus suberectus]